MRVIDIIVQSLKNLGGEATLKELYIEVNKYRSTPESSIRGRLYSYSSECDVYNSKNEDLFASSEGKGKGKWKFKKISNLSTNTWKDEIFYHENFQVGETFKTKQSIRKRSNLSNMKGNREPWTGYGTLANAILLFVNLDKNDAEDNLKYIDVFEGTEFFWQSQNKNSKTTPNIQKILEGINVYLFCRINMKNDWTYIGALNMLNCNLHAVPLSFHFELLDYNPNPDENLKLIYNWKNDNQSYVHPRFPDTYDDINYKYPQSYINNTEKKKTVENYAMKIAKKYYESKGFEVNDVSSERGKGYDLECSKENKILGVEVKGTQNDGSKIIITRGEVKFARKTKVNKTAVLFIVFDIEVIINKSSEYIATRGDFRIIENWNPTEEDLDPIAYDFRIPPINFTSN